MPFFFIISPEIPQLIAILISTDPRQLVQYVPNHFFTPARKIISPESGLYEFCENVFSRDDFTL